jgi:hypothetical protein
MTTATRTRKSAAVESVTTIARVQFKADPRKVVYLNRSSDGSTQYETSLFDGKATSCNCPSRKPCKHMIHSEQAEAYRQEALAEKERIETSLVLHQAKMHQAAIEKQERQMNGSPVIESKQVVKSTADDDPWEGLDDEARYVAWRNYEFALGSW